MRTHLKKHSEEKSNKCNQCNGGPPCGGFAGNILLDFIWDSFARFYLSTLLKPRSGEKSGQCNVGPPIPMWWLCWQCFARFYLRWNMRTHLKTHSGKKSYKMRLMEAPMWWLSRQHYARFHFRLICQILSEHIFENTQWKKVCSMQPVGPPCGGFAVNILLDLITNRIWGHIWRRRKSGGKPNKCNQQGTPMTLLCWQ